MSLIRDAPVKLALPALNEVSASFLSLRVIITIRPFRVAGPSTMRVLKQAWSSSLTLATRCAPTLGTRSLATVQVSMEKIKQSFTEDAFFRQLERDRERLEKIKLAKPQINENAPNLMKILEDEGVPMAMRETLKTQLLLWKHEDVPRGTASPL